MNKEFTILGRGIKDLIYEVAIVVVGILIAFFLDNWWGERENFALEEKLKSSLSVEFNKNRELLNNVVEKTGVSISSTLHLLKMSSEELDESNLRQFDSLLYNALYVPEYDPAMAVVQDIINSGKLNIIQNDSLRSRISMWTSHIEYKSNKEWIAFEGMERFISSYLYDHISFVEMDRNFSPISKELIGVPVLRHHDDILQDRKFRNFLDDRLWNLNNFEKIYSHLDEAIEEILHLTKTDKT